MSWVQATFSGVCRTKNGGLALHFGVESALKVINPWGDKWQAAVNDGWVMAKPLLESTKYRFGTLIWLVDRPPEHEPSE